jgi:hypothetical protein
LAEGLAAAAGATAGAAGFAVVAGFAGWAAGFADDAAFGAGCEEGFAAEPEDAGFCPVDPCGLCGFGLL